MKFLVTGGAGFIGSNIVKKLLSQEHTVRVLDNFATGKRENVTPFRDNPRFELVEGDLRSFHTVRTCVKDIDFVLHQGALPSVPRSIHDPITTNDVNISGTLNILEASKEFNVKRVVFASSSSVYGDNEILPKSEEMKINPLSPYALSKYTGERYCQIFSALYGLETVCLRYFNVFGPSQDPMSQYSAVIPKFIMLLENDQSPFIYGDGTQSRDFTYVDNVVNANLLACTAVGASGKVFNIACGERYSLLALIDTLNTILEKNIKPVFKESRPGDVVHSMASIEHAAQNLHYQPTVHFKDGLKKLVAYNRKLSQSK